MAYLLRGKQSGIQNDLSAGLTASQFVLDDIARYGINSRISVIAYDPVQSLLAVGTSETQFGSGQVYVFGRSRVSVVFPLPRKASCNFLQFCADKLVCVDSRHEISIFSLEKKTLEAGYSPPGRVSSLLTDPALDFAFIGLQSGDIFTYDLDRERPGSLRIPNLWKERSSRLLPVVSLAFHPRDIGTLLIGYPEGAVIFSLKTNEILRYFQYEAPPGAAGRTSSNVVKERQSPALSKAVWHPTGTFILAAFEDASLVFWDPKDSRVVLARTMSDNVDGLQSSDAPTKREPIFQLSWCCKDNPDDTGVLVAGGNAHESSEKYITFFELGPTPNYQTSSWQALSEHLANPRKTFKLATPPNAQVVDYCLIPRSSPFFAGAQDPIAAITLLSSGELVTLSFPSGHQISPTNMFHISLSFIQPFVNKLALSYVERLRWMGWREKRSQGPCFINGGAEGNKPIKRFETRDIVQAAHADGTIRIWDAGHKDELENPSVLQLDLPRAVGRLHNIEVTQMSLSGPSGEFSAGLKSGELVTFRWGPNQYFGREFPPSENKEPGYITDITRRADPNLKEGFVPFVLLDQRQGPVTALKHSNVGFVCVGYESGGIAIIDLRGPKLIFTAHVNDFVKTHRTSLIRRRDSSAGIPDYATSIEFGVLTLEDEDYSSILVFVGTQKGNLATFKILPSAAGYTVTFSGTSNLGSRVISISPINGNTGESARATQESVANLRNGSKVNGVVIAATSTGCRVFRPATSKGAHNDWDEFDCENAAVVRTLDRLYSLVGLFADGRARAYSIPALKEIGCVRISHVLDPKRLGDACITGVGDVLGWVGPSEVAVMDLFGNGLPLRQSDDALFNPMAIIPPRPTISNFQWISGTQYVTPSDLSTLIGGPDRPPSKRMIEQQKAEEQGRQAAGRAAGPGSSKASNDGYMSYMQKQVQQRTQKLNLAGDAMNRLEDTSTDFAEEVDRFVQNQKRKALFGAIGSKFGF